MRDKSFIAGVLKRFSFVKWDRFTENPDGTVLVYGWIDRVKNNYKDFILLAFHPYNNLVKLVSTSTTEMHEEVTDILNISTVPCKRVEYHFQIKNVAKV